MAEADVLQYLPQNDEHCCVRSPWSQINDRLSFCETAGERKKLVRIPSDEWESVLLPAPGAALSHGSSRGPY